MKLTVCMPIAEARGGAEVLLDRFVTSAHRAGVRLSVVFLEAGPMADAFRARGVDVCVVDAGRLRDVNRAPGVIRAIARHLRRFAPDLVLSWMTKAHLYAAPAAALAGIGAVWFQHGTPDPADAVTRLATLLPARGILGCSTAIAEAQGRLRPRRPTAPVFPCVDLDAFNPDGLPSPAEARSALGLPDHGPVVGIVARMQRWKGVHVFVDAMRRILDRHPGAHGVIVGGRHDLEPDYPALVADRIRDLALGERVQCVGFQTNVPEWMQAMDVVVHASDREPFGMVVIEAMALGKPVVAGAEGGPQEIITPGVDGLLAPYGDDEALARRVGALLDDPARAARMGTAARRRAADFSVPNFAPRLLDALAQVGLPRSPQLAPASS